VLAGLKGGQAAKACRGFEDGKSVLFMEVGEWRHAALLLVKSAAVAVHIAHRLASWT
jgi:hypothetical protein